MSATSPSTFSLVIDCTLTMSWFFVRKNEKCIFIVSKYFDVFGEFNNTCASQQWMIMHKKLRWMNSLRVENYSDEFFISFSYIFLLSEHINMLSQKKIVSSCFIVVLPPPPPLKPCFNIPIGANQHHNFFRSFFSRVVKLQRDYGDGRIYGSIC